MLNLAERQRKFEQLRAHWEAAELDEQGAEMVGRRQRPTPHHIAQDEAQHNSSSKFRRKLSNGLAFMSLSQRKDAPALHLARDAMSAWSANDGPVVIESPHALLSPLADQISPPTCCDPPAPPVRDTLTSEDVRPSASLPRSRTFSHIPRPVKADSEALSTVEMDESDRPLQDTVMTASKTLLPTRIPTPSPPQTKRRVSSPRQYLPSNPPLQSGAMNNRQPLVDTVNCSPRKAVIRSQTTPNLMKASNTPQTANNITPRRRGLKKPLASSMHQKPVLVENLPTVKRAIQRSSQIQDRPAKRESQAVPSVASNRRSFGPGTPLEQSKRYSLAPPVSTKRLSMHTAQKPAAAKHVSTELQGETNIAETARSLEETPITRPESVVSDSSLTPTLSTVNLVDPPLAPPPRLDVHDTQRRTLGTPNGLGARTGAWRSSKVFAIANYQVRRLPRSSTFHHFGKREALPFPSIPNQHESPSISTHAHLTPRKPSLKSNTFWHSRPIVSSGTFRISSRSLLSEIATAQRVTEAASPKALTTSTSTSKSRSAEQQPEIKSHQCTPPDISPKVCISRKSSDAVDSDPPDSTYSLTNILAIHKRPVSISRQSRLSGDLQNQRHWSISDRFCPDCADIPTYLQVKDYMPALYWAGRFQSRFDQWRTEAMVAMLHPDIKSEDEGTLGQCSIDDEKKAIVLIFMQLRDLCASSQAADSLHEFEYRYRKDHKLLDTRLDLPPSLRKPEEATPKGPIGRAVRKLTPRKASFANLFKGKGWSRSDDGKAADVSGHVRELQDITDSTTSFETTDPDRFESCTRLHVS